MEVKNSGIRRELSNYGFEGLAILGLIIGSLIASIDIHFSRTITIPRKRNYILKAYSKTKDYFGKSVRVLTALEIGGIND